MSGKNASAFAVDSGYIARLVGVLFGICLTVSLLLGVVNAVTEPTITATQEAKTEAAMKQVLPADSYEEASVTEDGVQVSRAYSGGAAIGWVVRLTSNGFGGAIDMVVGVSGSGAVTGVAVTKDSETANIGSKVVKDQAVLDRFIGMSHEGGEITVNSGSNRFDGVTGATVSSKGVAAGVNAALRAVQALS